MYYITESPAHDYNLSIVSESYSPISAGEGLYPGTLCAGEDLDPGTLHAGEDLDAWTLHAD